MNEFELIAKLTASLPTNAAVLTGAGDDCAVLDVGAPGRRLLFKTDAVVEGVHFLSGEKPERIGHKALARCLSDIAAMGGRPVAALVTLALPKNFDPSYVAAIYDGMNALARRYEVAIVGGETTTNPERMLLSVALIGESARPILRSGAQSGDAIFVTGDLGGSILGKHLDFEPRLAEGQWLTENYPLHAMIDISDGLVNDLGHILKSSSVGAELLAKAIPISRAARERARSAAPNSSTGGARPATPLIAALGDGEDFELLFCLPANQAVSLLDAWKSRFPDLRLSCVGKIRSALGLSLRDKTGVHTLEPHGYVHFA